MVHWGDEDHDRALADIQRVLATSARSERGVTDHFLCGLYLLDLADFAAAEQHFRAAIELGDRRGDPWHDGAAKLLLAVALLRQGRLGEARDIARALPEESLHWGGGQVWSRFDVLNYRPGV